MMVISLNSLFPSLSNIYIKNKYITIEGGSLIAHGSSQIVMTYAKVWVQISTYVLLTLAALIFY